MTKTNKTIATFGGGFVIQIAGATPQDTSRELNRLYNAGVLTSFDESFREGTDTTVLAKSYPARFKKGIATLASIQVRGTATKHNLHSLNTFRRLLKKESEQLREEFQRVENIYVDRRRGFCEGEVFPGDVGAK